MVGSLEAAYPGWDVSRTALVGQLLAKLYGAMLGEPAKAQGHPRAAEKGE